MFGEEFEYAANVKMEGIENLHYPVAHGNLFQRPDVLVLMKQRIPVLLVECHSMDSSGEDKSYEHTIREMI